MIAYTAQEFKEQLQCIAGVLNRLPDDAEILRIELSHNMDEELYRGAGLHEMPFAEIHINRGIAGNPQTERLRKPHYVKGWSKDFDMMFYIDNGVSVFELVDRDGRFGR